MLASTAMIESETLDLEALLAVGSMPDEIATTGFVGGLPGGVVDASVGPQERQKGRNNTNVDYRDREQFWASICKGVDEQHLLPVGVTYFETAALA